MLPKYNDGTGIGQAYLSQKRKTRKEGRGKMS
jgi:hypothetical protein